MPDRTVDPVYVPFTITTVAGTPRNLPAVTPLQVPRGILESVDLLVPSGHAGQTGILFTLSGQQILPWSAVVAWITGDGFTQTFEVGIEVDTLLRAITYNEGQFPHSHFVRCKIRQIAATSGMPSLTLLDNNELSA